MRNKPIVIFFIVTIIVLLAWLVSIIYFSKENSEQNIQRVSVGQQNDEDNEASEASTPSLDNKNFWPLVRADERVTKKPFGIYITSSSSPIQPERFAGYHTGADFEIFSEEINTYVSVKAICDGEILLKRNATGYGGVVVESCNIDNAPVTVVYGHLKLTSVLLDANDKISRGEELGILGADKSLETDGERKHLHLSIHKGVEVSILGYVQNKNALSDWVDPLDYIFQK